MKVAVVTARVLLFLLIVAVTCSLIAKIMVNAQYRYPWYGYRWPTYALRGGQSCCIGPSCGYGRYDSFVPWSVYNAKVDRLPKR